MVKRNPFVQWYTPGWGAEDSCAAVQVAIKRNRSIATVVFIS
jgi:hypothetical protein